MRTALLLVDLQNDFLNRPGLLPAVRDITGPIASVIAYARSSGMAIAHIRTQVSASGEDRMPHWQHQDIRECVAGTTGVKPPEEFEEDPGERVFLKCYFSGFGNSRLDGWLRSENIEALWVAGVYTHGCVRSTVMDAYERGYRVTVIDDGIASIDPLHARITRDYLNGRAARFVRAQELVQSSPSTVTHRNPDRPEELLITVLPSSDRDIQDSVAGAQLAQTRWCGESFQSRRAIFLRFESQLADSRAELLELMVRDLGKPRCDAQDELQRALGHLRAALELELELELEGQGTMDNSGATVVYQPLGTVAIITPWNNPVAIPIGKLSAALILGNSVVWKPAIPADNISRKLHAILLESGLPSGLLQLVKGGASQVCELVAQPEITAVSITGPEQAGDTVAPICRQSGKPLQAELGGNNALLVLADADLPALVDSWARLAFSYAGQRCTAIRRFVVEQSVVENFERLMTSAAQKLVLDQPSLESCVVGPLISATQLERVQNAVESALMRGARLLAGGESEEALAGYYYRPTLLADLPAADPLVQQELFGPVAIVQVAEDFDQGVELVNGVRQGLLAGIATSSQTRYQEFVNRAEVGIVTDGSGARIHPSAPFGGRKSSQIGPPEHGVWDRYFFSAPQVRYTR